MASPLMWLLACLAVTSLGCVPETDTRDAVEPTSSQTPPVEIQAAETERAVLRRAAWQLAGLSADPAAGSPAAEDSAPDASRAELWRHHAVAMESLWQLIEERHLSRMEQWAEITLDTPRTHPVPVFYPFGGPDFPSVQQFFPDASDYVLVGLEPPGTIPDLSAFDTATLDAELARLRDGLSNLAEKGYFVARHMVQDFGDAQRLEGFIPVLYIFLARGGYEPTAVRFVDLSPDGEVVGLDRLTAEEAYGVEIEFVPTSDPTVSPRRLSYWAQDLSNEGLQAKPGFAAFVRSLGDFDVYMKSAMYLPHEVEFSELQSLMFEGRSILQDDSGVPWGEFEAANWQVDLFGVYDQTLPNYREYFQPELAAAYATDAVGGPLPFAIGYNSQVSGSCLLWAQRRSVDGN